MKEFIFVAGGFIAGIGVGFFLFQPVTDNAMKMESSADHHATGMGHGMLEIDKANPIPSVTLVAHKDSKDGYNLELKTENFKFTPEYVGGNPVPNEGHAHLFVNGQKVARLYGNWFSLSSSHLKEGENIVEVSLNANDHSEWVVDGHHVGSVVSVTK